MPVDTATFVFAVDDQTAAALSKITTALGNLDKAAKATVKQMAGIGSGANSVRLLANALAKLAETPIPAKLAEELKGLVKALIPAAGEIPKATAALAQLGSAFASLARAKAGHLPIVAQEVALAVDTLHASSLKITSIGAGAAGLSRFTNAIARLGNIEEPKAFGKAVTQINKHIERLAKAANRLPELGAGATGLMRFQNSVASLARIDPTRFAVTAEQVSNAITKLAASAAGVQALGENYKGLMRFELAIASLARIDPARFQATATAVGAATRQLRASTAVLGPVGVGTQGIVGFINALNRLTKIDPKQAAHALRRLGAQIRYLRNELMGLTGEQVRRLEIAANAMIGFGIAGSKAIREITGTARHGSSTLRGFTRSFTQAGLAARGMGAQMQWASRAGAAMFSRMSWQIRGLSAALAMMASPLGMMTGMGLGIFTPLVASMYALYRVVKTSIRGWAEYQFLLTRIQGVTGGTAREVEGLDSMLAALAGTTRLSRKELAEAAIILGEYGGSVAELKDVMPVATKLAMAFRMEAAPAAEMLMRSLRAMGVETAEALRLADMLIIANQQSGASAKTLAGGLGVASAAARGTAWTMEEIVASVMMFADVLPQPRRVGSMLIQIKQALLSLQSPTKEQSRILGEMGKRVGLTAEELKTALNPALNSEIQILETLAAAGLTAAESQELFREEGALGIDILIGMTRAGQSNLALLKERIEALKEQGELERTLKDQETGLVVGWNQMKAAFGSLAIEIGRMATAGSPIFEMMSGMARAVSDYALGIKAAGAGVGQLVKDFTAIMPLMANVFSKTLHLGFLLWLDVARPVFKTMGDMFWKAVADGKVSAVAEAIAGAMSGALLKYAPDIASAIWTILKEVPKQAILGTAAGLAKTAAEASGYETDPAKLKAAHRAGVSAMKEPWPIVRGAIRAVSSADRAVETVDKAWQVGAPLVSPFASGGVVTKPTVALIGEAGPEAVVPLNKIPKYAKGAGIKELLQRIREEYEVGKELVPNRRELAELLRSVWRYQRGGGAGFRRPVTWRDLPNWSEWKEMRTRVGSRGALPEQWPGKVLNLLESPRGRGPTAGDTLDAIRKTASFVGRYTFGDREAAMREHGAETVGEYKTRLDTEYAQGMAQARAQAAAETAQTPTVSLGEGYDWRRAVAHSEELAVAAQASRDRAALEGAAERAQIQQAGLIEQARIEQEGAADRARIVAENAAARAQAEAQLAALRAPVQAMASGGVVTKPTIAMIGEAGPEAVVPLKKIPKYAEGAGVREVLRMYPRALSEEFGLDELFGHKTRKQFADFMRFMWRYHSGGDIGFRRPVTWRDLPNWSEWKEMRGRLKADGALREAAPLTKSQKEQLERFQKVGGIPYSDIVQRQIVGQTSPVGAIWKGIRDVAAFTARYHFGDREAAMRQYGGGSVGDYVDELTAGYGKGMDAAQAKARAETAKTPTISLGEGYDWRRGVAHSEELAVAAQASRDRAALEGAAERAQIQQAGLIEQARIEQEGAADRARIVAENTAARAQAEAQLAALRAPVQAMASGGVVTKPTIAMIGEAGPEYVIPARKLPRFAEGAGAISAFDPWPLLDPLEASLRLAKQQHDEQVQTTAAVKDAAQEETLRVVAGHTSRIGQPTDRDKVQAELMAAIRELVAAIRDMGIGQEGARARGEADAAEIGRREQQRQTQEQRAGWAKQIQDAMKGVMAKGGPVAKEAQEVGGKALKGIQVLGELDRAIADSQSKQERYNEELGKLEEAARDASPEEQKKLSDLYTARHTRLENEKKREAGLRESRGKVEEFVGGAAGAIAGMPQRKEEEKAREAAEQERQKKQRELDAAEQRREFDIAQGGLNLPGGVGLANWAARRKQELDRIAKENEVRKAQKEKEFKARKEASEIAKGQRDQAAAELREAALKRRGMTPAQLQEAEIAKKQRELEKAQKEADVFGPLQGPTAFDKAKEEALSIINRPDNRTQIYYNLRGGAEEATVGVGEL